MRPGGGKQKGAAFEREVCKRLSLWTTSGRRDDVFWRSAMSGGRATLLERKGKEGAAVAGDICAVAPEGNALVERYFIECKFYRDLSLLSFFFGKAKGKLHDFWKKAKLDAKNHKKQAMLIAKQNVEDTIVILDQEVPWGVQPLAYLVLEDAWVYWFDDLFPKPKPRLTHGRATRK